MNRLRQKAPRFKLAGKDYATLRHQILDRDGWKCQTCGSGLHLQVHHIKSRSDLGNDQPENLITLCAECHALQHRHRDRRY